MADEPVVFDRQSAELIRTTVLAEMARIKNRLLPEGIDSGKRSSDQWVPFINASSATIPERAIMAVIGSTFDDETNTQFLKVNKPSTTFYRQYAVNGALESTAEGGGLCAVSGPVQVLYEGTFTPTSTKSGGPKPGSWAINEGWPTAIDFFGTVNTTTKIAHGFLRPITTVVAKTSSAIAALSTANVAGTGTATIWTNTGSTFAESSPKQAFTGTNFSTVASTTSDLYGFTERDGVMCMDAPASAGGAVGIWQATLTADLLSSASSASVGSAVLMSDGSSASITSASNPLAYCGTSGKSVILAGRTGSYSIIGIGVTATTLILDVVTSSSAIEKVKRQAAVMFNESASTTATVIQLTTLCST